MTSEEFAKKVVENTELTEITAWRTIQGWAIKELAKSYLAELENVTRLVKEVERSNVSESHWRQRYVAENSELLRLREQVKGERAPGYQEVVVDREVVDEVFGGMLEFLHAIPHRKAEILQRGGRYIARWPKVTL